MRRRGRPLRVPGGTGGSRFARLRARAFALREGCAALRRGCTAGCGRARRLRLGGVRLAVSPLVPLRHRAVQRGAAKRLLRHPPTAAARRAGAALRPARHPAGTADPRRGGRRARAPLAARPAGGGTRLRRCHAALPPAQRGLLRPLRRRFARPALPRAGAAVSRARARRRVRALAPRDRARDGLLRGGDAAGRRALGAES